MIFFSEVLKYLILHRLFSHSVGGWGAGSYKFTDILACDLVPLSCLERVRVTPGGRWGGRANPPPKKTLCLFLLSATEILNLTHLHSLCCHLFQFDFFFFESVVVWNNNGNSYCCKLRLVGVGGSLLDSSTHQAHFIAFKIVHVTTQRTVVFLFFPSAINGQFQQNILFVFLPFSQNDSCLNSPKQEKDSLKLIGHLTMFCAPFRFWPVF